MILTISVDLLQQIPNLKSNGNSDINYAHTNDIRYYNVDQLSTGQRSGTSQCAVCKKAGNNQPQFQMTHPIISYFSLSYLNRTMIGCVPDKVRVVTDKVRVVPDIFRVQM